MRDGFEQFCSVVNCGGTSDEGGPENPLCADHRGLVNRIAELEEKLRLEDAAHDTVARIAELEQQVADVSRAIDFDDGLVMIQDAKSLYRGPDFFSALREEIAELDRMEKRWAEEDAREASDS